MSGPQALSTPPSAPPSPSVERAGELVNALPPDRYREYLDAYRAAER
jgi:hypothetical protein